MEGIVAHTPKVYEPKRFGKSPLYRILVDYWEDFTSVYEQRFEHLCGSLRSVVERVVDRFIDCGNPLCGFARIRCENCKKERIRPFYAKQGDFVRHAKQGLPQNGVYSWLMNYWNRFHTDIWFSQYPKSCVRIFGMIGN